jgi:arylsulfatase A-like enzyme
VDLAYLRGLYQGEVAYADSRVGQLVEQVRLARGQGGQTIWLVTADHGDAFNEHGVMEHVADLHEPVMRVPLILAAPGVPAGARIGDQVRTIDFLPTLLELAGLEPPPDIPGVSLTPLWRGGEIAPRPAAAVHYGALDPEYAFIAWPWKLFYRPDSSYAALHNLEHDPAESSDLSASHPDQLRLMSALARALLALPPSVDGAAAPIDAQTWKALDELGYLNRSRPPPAGP